MTPIGFNEAKRFDRCSNFVNDIKFGREALKSYRTLCKLQKNGQDIGKIFFLQSIHIDKRSRIIIYNSK